ncbi:MAG: T9SS type A sorting domain-containing protein, partial [Bacteroidota bacterium]
IEDLVTVTVTNSVATNYVYLVTDENNIILDISTEATIDFDEAPNGICRVWGLAYQGDLLAEAGQDAAAVTLASVCFDLSDNFITVNRTAIDGGTVSLTDGTTLTFACGGDGQPDFFTFISTSTATADYTYVVTNNENTILAVLDGDAIDLEDAAPGTCRVWGLSYSGNIIALAGQNAAEVALTDACFELSSNFVTIVRDEVTGGMVSVTGGGTLVNICPNDDTPDELTFANTGTSTGLYGYILTDANNQVISLSNSGVLDFNNLNVPTQVRVWGFAYTGLANLGTGSVFDASSDRCFSLSDNFVTIIRETPEGGSVSTSTGATSLTLCTDDGIDDNVSFDVSGASNTDYVYLITDENNIIIDLLTNTNTANFEGASAGICRVWGVAFTGTLLAQVGDDAAAIALSDDCFDLSDDFVTITRGDLDAGRIITALVEQDRFTCPGDGLADLIQFDSIDVASDGTSSYVLTDENNIIIDLPATDVIDFETLPEGVYRVWNLLYTGDLLATLGDDAGAVTIASGCFDLSDNFITVTNIAPVAGTLTTDLGDTVTICIGDNMPDPFTVTANGASAAAYTFLVVDLDSTLIGNLEGPTFDFDNAAPGDWYIYGLSYTGALSVLPGANIFTDQLASGCNELSDNFIFVDKTQVDGGALFTDAGAQVVYTCPDGTPDIVNFINSGSSPEDEYHYVLTTQNNLVLQILDGNTIDFEVADGLNALRMWGVSYTGDLNLNIGNNITTVDLSTGCNVLSDNFVDIFLDQPDGGMLSFEDGSDSLRLCHSSFMPGVQVNTTSTSVAGYAYLITDEDNVVLEVSESSDGFVNFDNVTPGTYRIWAVSYTGSLLVEVGDDAATTTLASSCFELSDNFVTVVRTETLTGGTVSDVSGEEVIYFCPNDDVSDIVILTHNSPDANLRYIITDDQDRILFGDVESNVINFDVADPGICRIYGISYTGDYNNLFMANIREAVLSTDCWALSDNYLTIVRETPEGGTVSTVDGLDMVTITAGDGNADELTFTNTGGENAPYVYVITDEQNVILGTSADGVIDFEGAGVGTCRVWGLSYTGNILVGMGDNAGTSTLTDDCFDLSDNFVTVIRTSSGNIDDNDTEGFTTETAVLSLNLYPNPATSQINLNVQSSADVLGPQQNIQVYDLNGMLLMNQAMAPNTQSQLSIDVSSLQAGVYLLRWYDGQQVVLTRFTKL